METNGQTPILEVATMLTTPKPEKIPPYTSVEEAQASINEAKRVQEAWVRTFKSIKDFPDNEESFVELFDQRLSSFGILDEEQVLGAQLGMNLLRGSLQEIVNSGLALPGKEDEAMRVVDRVDKLMSVLEKHTSTVLD